MSKPKLLSARERNILKHRSYQIMLYLFHVEDLKRFIIGSMRATNEISGISNDKVKFNDLLKKMVEDEIINENEKSELVSLIDFRNDISHEIYKMVNDLGDTRIFQVPQANGNVEAYYQYGALTKLKILSAKIHRGFQNKYAMQVSFDSVIFEPAEKALEYESKLMFSKILKEELKEIYKV